MFSLEFIPFIDPQNSGFDKLEKLIINTTDENFSLTWIEVIFIKIFIIHMYTVDYNQIK